jgi:hypothetical protein
MKNLYFKIDENKNVVPGTVEECEKILSSKGKIVKQNEIDNYFVLTVFLCINHNFFHTGRPVVFETMIFEGDEPLNYQERYCTWKEAEEGHERAVQWVKDGCKDE